MNKEILLNMLMIRDQLHVFHWTAPDGTAHNALGGAYDEFLYNLDKYMEAYMGKYPAARNDIFSDMKAEIELVKFTEDDVKEFMANVMVFLTELPIESSDTELMAIRDDMMAVFSKLMYLISLN